MKALLIFVSLVFTNGLFSQTICMVSADFQTGENMLVMWEWPAVTTGIDSVLVHRKTASTAGVYVKIGGTSVNQLSTFTDLTAITTDWNYYTISYKYTNGTESSQSPWHRPMLLDYGVDPITGSSGYISWTEYEIEGQTSIAYIVGYTCSIDQNGLGNYTVASTLPNTSTGWWDQGFANNPNTSYMVEVELPNCNITKANINTSRSNIKKQMPNDELGIALNSASILTISPNPVQDILTIPNAIDFQLIEIINQSGKVVYSTNTAPDGNEIILDFLKPGLYFIRAHDSNDGVFANKLVKL